ncbi:MAG: hypothetical protein J3K34DRAFT_415996 [Monoraphidium minutum]|nr:MAG: hypothetical protein J3K34DRAFT_415996 [Monoraphidium minutum]
MGRPEGPRNFPLARHLARPPCKASNRACGGRGCRAAQAKHMHRCRSVALCSSPPHGSPGRAQGAGLAWSGGGRGRRSRRARRGGRRRPAFQLCPGSHDLMRAKGSARRPFCTLSSSCGKYPRSTPGGSKGRKGGPARPPGGSGARASASRRAPPASEKAAVRGVWAAGGRGPASPRFAFERGWHIGHTVQNMTNDRARFAPDQRRG